VLSLQQLKINNYLKGRMKRTTALIFILHVFIILQDAYSQRHHMFESYVDSLKNCTTLQDSVHHSCMVVWCCPYRYKDTMMPYAELALQLSLQLNDSNRIADSYDAIARSYWWNNNTERAKKYYEKALHIALRNKYFYKVAHVYKNLAGISNQEDDIETFKIYMKKSIRYFEQTGLDIFALKCYMSLIREANQNQYIKPLISGYEDYLYDNTFNYWTLGVYLDLAHLYTLNENRKMAIENLFRGIEIADSTNNIWVTTSAYMQIADYFKDYQHNYPVAYLYYKKVLDMKVRHNMNAAHDIYNKIGDIYRLQGKDSLAVVFFKQQLRYGKKQEFAPYYALAYINLGNINFDNEDYRQAIDYYEKAFYSAKDYLNSIKYHHVLLNIGDAYQHLNSRDTARAFYQKSLDLAKAVEDNRSMSKSYQAFARLYKKKGNNVRAISFYLQAYNYALEGNMLDLQQENAYFLCRLYENQQNFRDAYRFLNISNQLSDTIKSRNEAKSLARLETLFEYKNIQEQRKKDKQLADEQINRQKQSGNFLLAGFVMTMLFGALLFLAYKRKQKDNVLLRKQKTAIEQMSKKIHEEDQTKLRFFTNISHELRTPLTMITGLCEELLNRSGESGSYVSSIHRNAGKMRQLIDNLLDLRKLDEAKMKLVVAWGNLSQCIEGIVAHFEKFASDREIILSVETLSEQEISGYFDYEKIEKIFSNLISNAVKFTKPGGKIRIFIENDITGYALIKVTDTGVGMSEDETEQIFTRFYTLTKNEKQGSGIGLALVKELIELHKGKIQVQSNVNEGTTFFIKLPVAKCLYQDNEISATPISKNKLSYDNNFSMNEGCFPNSTDKEEDKMFEANRSLILIVEDNDDLRRYVAHIFNDTCNIIEAVNGKQGIEAAKKYVPDIIISDIMMPEIDGIELVNKIKTNETTSHIPIILLTAKTDKHTRLNSFDKGADEYIIKPFESEILKSRVHNLLRLRKQLVEKFARQYQLQPREILIEDADQKFLQKTIQVIENSIAEEHLSVEFLASELGVSRTQLYRKLKALTDYSANQFIRIIRMKRAAQLISQGQNNISEIMTSIGFTNYTYFKNCFKEHFGKLPKEYLADSVKVACQ
jgi:signal transduction histidine kinase/DNA-binding response OmpR family regulator